MPRRRVPLVWPRLSRSRSHAWGWRIRPRASNGAIRPPSERRRTAVSCAAFRYRLRGASSSPGIRFSSASQIATGGAGARTTSCARRSASSGTFSRTHPQAPRVGIGDLGLPHGGYFGPEVGGGIGHFTHQNGLDVDVYYPRLDRAGAPAGHGRRCQRPARPGPGQSLRRGGRRGDLRRSEPAVRWPAGDRRAGDKPRQPPALPDQRVTRHCASPSLTAPVAARPSRRATAAEARLSGWMYAMKVTTSRVASQSTTAVHGLGCEAGSLFLGSHDPGQVGLRSSHAGLNETDEAPGRTQSQHPVEPAVPGNLPRVAGAEFGE